MDRASQTDPGSNPRQSVLANPFLWAALAMLACVVLVLSLLMRQPRQPPLPEWGKLPDFTLVSASDLPFGSEDLVGRVWVANFFFTRCGSICPRLMDAMSRLDRRYAEAGIDDVHLVSFSVDPEYDTPEQLRRYGPTYGVDPQRWTLLTGERSDIEAVVVGGFRTAMGEAPDETVGPMDIAHTGKFVLVDSSGEIRGYYDSDPPGLNEIFLDSQRLLRSGGR